MTVIRSIGQYNMNSFWYYAGLLWRTVLKRFSAKKLPNMIQVCIEWKAHRIQVSSRPVLVRIEVSAVCNLKCLSCRTPQKQFNDGQPRMMTLANFQTIYRKLAKYANRLTFYMEGEPMSNPSLFEMVRFASDGTVFTSFCTNFTLMKPELLGPLFASKLDWISVCLDGYTQKVYEKYRVNGQVARVKEGIRAITQYKQQHHLNYPFVNIFTILFRHVLAERDAIAAFCQESRVNQLTFRPDESNLDGTYSYKAPKLPASRCFWPWLTINIDVDGSVYPCPISFERADRIPYGNLSCAELEEIWNNNLFLETRRYLKGRTGKRPGLNLPCYNCRWYGSAGEVQPSAEQLQTISPVAEPRNPTATSVSTRERETSPH